MHIEVGKDMNPDALHEFWERIEQVHGTVQAKSMVVYMEAMHKKKFFFLTKPYIERWGLLYTTDKGLFFYFFPKKNMFSQMFNRSEEQQFFLECLWDNIESCTVPERYGFFTRLSGKGIESLDILATVTTVRYATLLLPYPPSDASTTNSSKNQSKHPSINAVQDPQNVMRETIQGEFKFRLDFNKEQILSSLRMHIPQKITNTGVRS